MFNLKLPLLALLLASTQPSMAVPLKILPLGDSITDGQFNGDFSYRNELYNKLKYAGYTYGLDYEFVGTQNETVLHDGVNLVHEGHVGDRADVIEANLDTYLANYDVDIALVHAGTNDIDQTYRGTFVTPDTDTLDELEGIIGKLQAKNSNVEILIAKLLPYHDPADGTVTDQTVGLNSLLDSTWESAQGVTVVDQNTGFVTSHFQTDLVHPNSAGEEKMAENWFNELVSVLPTITVATPPITSGMTVHLDAADVDGDGSHDVVTADADVTTWVNKASNSANQDVSQVTNTTPAKQSSNATGLNAKPVIDFDGAGLETTATGQITADTSYTKFVVYKVDTIGLDNNLVSSSSPNATNLYAAFSSNMRAVHDIGNNNGLVTVSNDVAIDTSSYQRLAYRYDPSGLENKIFLDGSSVGASNTTVAPHRSSNAKTSIGSIGNGFFLDGKIAEVIIYDTALTDAEIGLVDNYLDAKWFGTQPVDPNLTITSPLPATDRTIGVPFTVAYTSDNSFGAITYSASPANVCTVDATSGDVTTVGIGTCNLSVSQEASVGYTADLAGPVLVNIIAEVVDVDPNLEITTANSEGTVGISFAVTHTTDNTVGAVSYSATPANVCTVDTSSGLVSPVGVGACSVTASQAASTGFTADTAGPVVVTINAAPVDPNLAISAPSSVTVGDSFTATHTSDNSSALVTYTAAPAAVCTIDSTSGVVSTVGVGTCTIGASQIASTGFIAGTADLISVIVNAVVVPEPTDEEKAQTAVTNVITGSSTTVITKAQLELLGVNNVKDNFDYNAALLAGTYADKNNPTLAELQKVIDQANEDSISTGSSGGGSISSMFLLALGFVALRRRKLLNL